MWPFTKRSRELISKQPRETSSSPSARFAFRLFRQLASPSKSNERHAMSRVGPRARGKLTHNLADLTFGVSSGSWESWIAKPKLMKGTIQLPRFKVDYDAQLKSALTALGMDRAF